MCGAIGRRVAVHAQRARAALVRPAATARQAQRRVVELGDEHQHAAIRDPRAALRRRRHRQPRALDESRLRWAHRVPADVAVADWPARRTGWWTTERDRLAQRRRTRRGSRRLTSPPGSIEAAAPPHVAFVGARSGASWRWRRMAVAAAGLSRRSGARITCGRRPLRNDSPSTARNAQRCVAEGDDRALAGTRHSGQSAAATQRSGATTIFLTPTRECAGAGGRPRGGARARRPARSAARPDVAAAARGWHALDKGRGGR